MLEMFLDAPLPIQLHMLSAMEALVLGPFVLWRQSRDRLHRILGYVWVVNMALAATSSLLIHGEMAILGPFGPIHALSVWSLWVLWRGIGAARAGDVARHRGLMQASMSTPPAWSVSPAN